MRIPRSKHGGLALVEVPFYGDTIQAVKTPEGKIMVHLKRLCESLGIDFAGQYTRLRNAHWATIEMISTPDQRGRPQRLAMIALKSLPMWLVTIQPSKVAFAVRDKLMVYQKEACEVLERHFLGDLVDRAPMINEIVRLQEHGLRLSSAIDKLTDRVNTLVNPFGCAASEYMTINEFCERYNIKTMLGEPMDGRARRAAGQFLASWCRKMKIEIKKSAHENPKYGFANKYRFEMLQIWSALGAIGQRANSKCLPELSHLFSSRIQRPW